MFGSYEKLAVGCLVVGGIIGGVVGFGLGRSTAPLRLVSAPLVETNGVVKVVRVIDGDTIEIESGEKVRYLGINTPESTTKHECFGKEAAAKNRELVEGRMVQLVKDKRDREKYGRLLRYVYIGEENINLRLVGEGFGRVNFYGQKTEFTPIFERAERDARYQRRGLWGACSMDDTQESMQKKKPRR